MAGRSVVSRKKPSQIWAMALIGAGLLVLGVGALLALPRLDSAARTGDSPSAVPAVVYYPAPALELNDLQGNPVSLEDYRGTVVLLNNWATWCPPCKEEMPTLQAYFEEHRNQGFTIVAIEAGEPPDKVQAFVEDFGLTFPVWLDPRLQATAAFHNPGLPTSYLIDRQGSVRLAWAGAISRQMLEKHVTPLLEE
jgi:peroxiredoxin